ncbi:tRNA (cytidine(34)-2'-O)-methyltransferase [Aureliella helgolandensis]|uniref:Putative tRNA (cytidine(34)-2'-O)-methyltransferase n=1 Tax=Aureliella helgolandensis TaxID=2527968 RepID=A0A518G286_9BACT|nr:tRNA (cytidine(34)-2'-O)-methyltransferase [Aureliella helgolandensis]QDV22680.1 Putative tRNA (cytidine(34)-2'-O)-methyltransferase [Aureliella helgolandensis]
MTATGSAAASLESPPLHVVLYQPEIPQNTGNIGRTCVALGAKLWMVRPVGFRLDSSQLKRSGMDYWNDLDWELVDNWQHLRERLALDNVWLVTKYGEQRYCDVTYQRGDILVFGNESSGLPDSIHAEFADRQICLPMPGPVRCLNLATTAGIAIYEAARQLQLFDQECASAEPPHAS